MEATLPWIPKGERALPQKMHHCLHSGVFMFGCGGRTEFLFSKSVFVHIVSFPRKYYNRKNHLILTIADLFHAYNGFPLNFRAT